jgi:hypothetical protein
MEKCIPGNLVGHGNSLWEVRRHKAQARTSRTSVAYVVFVSPKSRECRIYRASVALHA